MLSEFSEKSFGENLRHLLKLCNYNTFLLLKAGVPATGEIRTAIDSLKENKIIMPSCEVITASTDWEVYRRYFRKYYVEDNSVSRYGLIRYCRLPFKTDLFDIISLGIAELQSDFLLMADDHISQVRDKYMEEQVKNLQLWDRPEAIKAIILEKRFSVKVSERFTVEDFEQFIDDPSNLLEGNFQKYLCNFCKKHNVDSYFLASRRESAFLEHAALSTMLELSKVYLGDRVMRCWTSLLSAILYS